jgi:hypothetical protein
MLKHCYKCGRKKEKSEMIKMELCEHEKFYICDWGCCPNGQPSIPSKMISATIKAAMKAI